MGEGVVCSPSYPRKPSRAAKWRQAGRNPGMSGCWSRGFRAVGVVGDRGGGEVK